jgi:hypothetical protein
LIQQRCSETARARQAVGAVPSCFLSCHLASLLNSDLRLIQSCAATGWTPARLRQLPFVERESTRATPRRKNQDTISGRLGRTDRMSEILFGVPACQAQITRNGRHRSRLGAEQGDQILPNRHEFRRTSAARLSSRMATKDACRNSPAYASYCTSLLTERPCRRMKTTRQIEFMLLLRSFGV